MRRLPALLAVLLFVVPLAAQTRHQIFKIEFRSRIPSNILLSQSALSEDRTYTDEELQLALARLRRLPFVYGASYTIEGSTIVIEVIDEYRLFYHLDTLGQIVSSGGGGGGHVVADLGGRLYAPWGGVGRLSYGIQSESGGRGNEFTAEYAQYGLLGSRLFAVLAVSKPSKSGSTTHPSATIGYPLTLRQTVYVRGFKTKFSDFEPSGTSGGFSSSDKEDNVAAGWRWDTTNDPLFATRGLAAQIERGSTKTDGSAISISSSGRVVFASDHKSDTDDWGITAKNFWPRRRGAFTAAVDYLKQDGTRQFRTAPATTFTLSNVSNTSTQFTVGYAYNFFPLISELRNSRHRVEGSLGLKYFDSTTGSRKSSTSYVIGELGYAFRNRRGTFHLVLSYLNNH
jgi:hypothetical protein